MKLSSMFVSGMIVALAATSASAQTATQTVTFQVDAVNQVGVTGSPTMAITAAVDMVTGITKLNASGLALTYQLDATSAAGVITSTTRVVTYTITGGV